MIQDRQTLVLEDNRGEVKLVTLHPTKSVTWRKQSLPVFKLIGQPFGQPFALEHGELVPIPQSAFYDKIDIDHEDSEAKDNRHIFSAEGAQRLDHEAIESLKSERRGEQMVALIAQNNSKFEQRTAYSKEKYLKRKKAKYLFYFVARQPTPHQLAVFYLRSDPKRTCYLRPDMLGLLLLHCSVRPGARFLVLDRTSLLVAGALAKRVAGAASIVLFKTDAKISPFRNSVLDELDLSKEERGSITAMTLDELQDQTFSHLVLAGDFVHRGALAILLPFLSLGGRVACYSQYNEVLAESFQYMMEGRKCISVQLMDSFCRTMQVLPNRTHPSMSTPQFSGYLLWGIKALSEPHDVLPEEPAADSPLQPE